MTTVILVRHGRTAMNRQQRLQGQSDIPLDAIGRGQAEELAQSMAVLRPDAVYSSPLQRAAETARLLAAPSGAPVRLHEAFMERSFGDWEGLTRAEIAERWPEASRLWETTGMADGFGIEPRARVAQRFATAVRALVEEHDGVVVVVAHGAAITLGIMALLGGNADGPRVLGGLDNCACSVLEKLQNPAGAGLMRLVSHNGRPDFAQWA